MNARSDPPGSPDAAALARDWRTIVESECAALAEDREVAETLAALARFWAWAMALLATSGVGARADEHGPAAGTDAPARPPPAGAASGVGDAHLDSLARRVAELESRLAELEREHGAGGGDVRQPGRHRAPSTPNPAARPIGRRQRRQP